MKMSQWAATLAAICIAMFPAIAVAADSTLVLVLGGEAYDGPPKFAVTFDGKSLGEGTVAAAIDTGTTGRFADAADKTPYVQSFTFAVPEAVFRPEGEVAIKFLNEAYGGEGSNRDRNLYLASVSLNGRAVTASGLATVTANGIAPSDMLGEFLVIADGSRQGVTKAPQGGWPLPEGAVAEAKPSAPAQTADADPATTSTVEVKPSPSEKSAASTDPDPEVAGPKCDLDELYNVIGFNENSNELTPKLIERLDQVVADIGDRQCNVQVTGYSSKQGATASNALFAIERAQNSLRYLQEHGVKFVRASATGVGATDQFGPDFRSNRRVVITVSP
ncbi:MAG: OmpA family protein [Devosia nanyangense]|uniref:OmpA family protein n=1 Tax=Devosia nanyangense TaxID=1228055 RepID=A0A933L4W8_9HYPH|nr:OmpA family protein [Devosia nanyangense]